MQLPKLWGSQLVRARHELVRVEGVDHCSVVCCHTQGAKPGEGGQLPGKKVSPYIANLRRSKPGGRGRQLLHKRHN